MKTLPLAPMTGLDLPGPYKRETRRESECVPCTKNVARGAYGLRETAEP